MAPQKLGDGLLLGVPRIDREHQEIMDIASDFRAAVEAGRPRAELGVHLARMAAAVTSHFISEEEFMLESGFGGWQTHRDEHTRLLEQLCGAEREFASGVIQACGALVLFVEIWAEQHILSQDREFALFLKRAS
jgi:hemerythrin